MPVVGEVALIPQRYADPTRAATQLAESDLGLYLYVCEG